jgi:hypothetical protein
VRLKGDPSHCLDTVDDFAEETTVRRSLSLATGMSILTLAAPVGAQGTREEPRIARVIGQVKDGVFLAQHGVGGHASSLTLRGKIQSDGSATIDARGITGDPRYNLNNETKGTPYAYRAIARFDGSRGTGSRIDNRPCNLTFAR